MSCWYISINNSTSIFFVIIFYRAIANAYILLTVFLSKFVCPSVKRVHPDKTKYPIAEILVPYKRTVFCQVIDWYVAPKPPQRRAQKRKMAVYRLKVHFSQRKSATKFFLCQSHQRQSCKAFNGLSIRAKIVGGRRAKTAPPFKNVDLQSIFVRSASVLTLSKKLN